MCLTTLPDFGVTRAKDNDRDGGRIRTLADAVSDEYALLTGRDLTLFIDRDIDWGEAWKERIDEALAATTFFIPVITPRYFSRPECRRELLTFSGHAKSLGREELLLPIYYVDVPGLGDDAAGDEAMELVSAMNWSDWRQLRLEATDSTSYRKMVSTLAGRLAKIADAPEPPGALELVSRPVAEDDDPGTLELVAEAEDAFPKFNATIDAMGGELDRLTELAERWSPVIARAAEKGAGPTLHALKAFADELSGPADALEALGRTYSSELVRIDPAVLGVIRSAELGLWEEADARELFSSLRTMSVNGDEAASMLTELAQTITDVSTLSRELKRPLQKVKDGLKNVRDGQAVLNEWHRRADQVEEGFPGANDE